jgi:hypothetical protein
VAAHALGARVEVSPETLTVAPGDTFTVELTVPIAGDPFNTFNAGLAYDPAALHFVSRSQAGPEGPLLIDACPGHGTFHVFAAAGDSLDVMDSMMGAGCVTTGPGTLLRLRFVAPGPGAARAGDALTGAGGSCVVYPLPDADPGSGSRPLTGSPGGRPPGLGARNPVEPPRAGVVECRLGGGARHHPGWVRHPVLEEGSMSHVEVRGRFIWHELMTTDPSAALLLYPRVVGWEVNPSLQDPSYTLMTLGGVPRAGVMRLPEEAAAMGAPPNWTSYIGTPDVDATARQSEDLGGKVLRSPMDIAGVCRFAILQDPQGAVFAAFQSLGFPTPDSTPGRGDFSWHELASSDSESAFEFYAALFGWERTESMEMGPMGVYQMFGHGGPSVGGMYTVPRDLGVPSHWLPYALVADSHRAAAAMEAGGGRVISAPMQIPGGDWVAKLVDPQGAVFAVHSLQAETATAAPARKEAKRAAAPRRTAAKPRLRAGKVTARRAAPARKVKSKGAMKKSAAGRKPARKSGKPAVAKTAARRKSARKKAGAKKTVRRAVAATRPKKKKRSVARKSASRARRSRATRTTAARKRSVTRAKKHP